MTKKVRYVQCNTACKPSCEHSHVHVYDGCQSCTPRTEEQAAAARLRGELK